MKSKKKGKKSYFSLEQLNQSAISWFIRRNWTLAWRILQLLTQHRNTLHWKLIYVIVVSPHSHDTIRHALFDVCAQNLTHGHSVILILHVTNYYKTKKDSYCKQIARQHSCHKNFLPRAGGVIHPVIISSNTVWSPCKNLVTVSHIVCVHVMGLEKFLARRYPVPLE